MQTNVAPLSCRVPHSQVEDCPRCNGAGSVVIRHYSNDPQLDTDVVCGECGGCGEVLADLAEAA